MFVINNQPGQLIPVKVWLNDISQLEEECLQQALNLSKLPFAFRHIALMPDTHAGFGMPIGGVLAADNVVIPNAVGVDIGCGMCFAETDIPKTELTKEDLQHLVGQIMRNIPTGFNHHKSKQTSQALDSFVKQINAAEFYKPWELVKEIDSGYYQIGTLGGGNHFIEIQADERGMVCVMLHSGSRNFGLKIARHFNEVAKRLNEQWQSPVPKQYDLAFLPLDTPEGNAYMVWMDVALQFAMENRRKMMDIVMNALQKRRPGVRFSNTINAHHNYAALENHFGREVMVHRKGAIRARQGELGIIPGAMGTYSYIVEGLGNEESFHSCSHGAGRTMSRKKAVATIPVDKTMEDLKQLGVVLGKNKKGDISEESRFAYKDIDFVISQELDLIRPVKKLMTMAVIKG
ncbi:RtcB family protein [Desulforamulus putei]|uniref:3'-phosphate/5'-hydroxy nucleic acid ligase n=1 Tax=Desulforamulus putei DSM 12395 TaxID=1121429 RepID=A0A1M5C606_9FIRM|nr:RtcB family protein [Desulforamulus putei]SHF50110.1 tRNA-splicing ligase RtcB [Desulforamulus putei DSM 12395]